MANDMMFQRLKVALRPFLHHGIDAHPDVETEAVRAVLTAMREPTEAMVDASVGALTLEGGWRAMIDAALAERTPSDGGN